MREYPDRQYDQLLRTLKSDCGNCCGLCCTALNYTKTDGFPSDKKAGMPCKYLQTDFRCGVHPERAERNFRGCMAYECIGAGQKVTGLYSKKNWRANPEIADQMFQDFWTVTQYHQMLWYLAEASRAEPAQDFSLRDEIHDRIQEIEQAAGIIPGELPRPEVEALREKTNAVLKKIIGRACKPGKAAIDGIGRNFRKARLDGTDFSMALLIAANLEGCGLKGASFLGADLRDTNLRNTDLRDSLFLTQMQINSAKGNRNTLLPPALTRPEAWKAST